MSAFTRTLVIYNKLEAPATLVFSFDDQLMQGIYSDYFPTVFRVIPFPAGDQHSGEVSYKNQLVFTSPQIENGVIVRAATYEPIGLGERTVLKLQDGIIDFTTPESGTAGVIQALNQTNQRTDIGVGFLKDARRPSTVLVWRQVSNNANVTAEFTPKLSAYVTTDYQENEVLRGAIQTGAIWQENLAKLPLVSSWIFKEDAATGEYKLEPLTMI
ncbi:hypothetical protein M422DRAFT_252119 [Sphaerobolus stellatus SS14]|uniref:Uncharacterized protein n=1 Tax=Sphaerobolus stellatus (strain SS14) TaxID=990650 RepID=A0A0C9VQD8_SPHS4|nr:hypothetical protein M422DRAFT_252119 [Sphaerobolus stellatus SS14]